MLNNIIKYVFSRTLLDRILPLVWTSWILSAMVLDTLLLVCVHVTSGSRSLRIVYSHRYPMSLADCVFVCMVLCLAHNIVMFVHSAFDWSHCLHEVSHHLFHCVFLN